MTDKCWMEKSCICAWDLGGLDLATEVSSALKPRLQNRLGSHRIFHVFPRCPHSYQVLGRQS